MKFELGLFENPYVDEGKVLEVFETPEQRLLARRIACQSMVLLKNDGLLPLPKTLRSLAVIGPNAQDERNLLSDYSYASMRQLLQLKPPENSSFSDVDENELSKHDVKTITVLEGIRSAVSPETKILYAQGCDIFGGDTTGFAEAMAFARQADAVVLVLGDKSGLTPDCTTGETRDASDLRLPGVQEGLLNALLATRKPVAVVLVTGRPYALPLLAEKVNAVLQAWLPGEEGGAAVADMLFGDVNPGGKLPITFPRSVGQIPVFYNAKPAGTRSHWYVDYVSEKVTPLYPFGHGLSYTSFTYRDLSIERSSVSAGESVDVSLKVSNTGKVAGDEVVQLYIHNEYASIPRPVKELKGYKRITLDPGETRRVTFHLPVNQLAFYDLDLDLVIEPGKIQVMVGSSSEDIRLCGAFEVTGESKMKVEDRVFVCPVSVE
jgi:beta-glucosidase